MLFFVGSFSLLIEFFCLFVDRFCLLDGGGLGLSPDGPKGPVYEVKPGVVFLAQKLQIPIVPITNALSRKLVLKRSWDYGGRAVFLGIDTPPARWRELLDRALAPGDVWVVQERVDAPVERRVVVGRGAIDSYVDLCAFTSLGLRTTPRGGASRAAPTRIVNILGGGGLAPVLSPEVATLAASGASSPASSS